MEWRPEPEQASAWSAIGGVVVVVSATSAVLLAVQPSSTHVPGVVIYGCVVLALVGLYGMLAPLLKWWPWQGVSAAFGGQALPKRIKGESINLAALDPSRAIVGRHFKGCELFGPVPILLGECHVEHTEWADPAFQVLASLDQLAPETIRFYGCRFSECLFSGFTAVGTQAQVIGLKALFPPGPARRT